MSNLPPGVSDSHPMIGGGEEYETECTECGGDVVAYGRFSHSFKHAEGLFSYTCDHCGAEQWDMPIVLEPDEDEGRDR